MESMTSFIFQGILGMLLALCAYFLNRLISQNDTRHGQTQDSIRELGTKLERISYDNHAFRTTIDASLKEVKDTVEDIKRIKYEYSRFVLKFDETLDQVKWLEKEQKHTSSEIRDISKSLKELQS